MLDINSKTKPLVTVAFPVYNEGRFIKESLKSILDQDYQNYEIIISDNASTDDTSEICKKYADVDQRISYFRQDNNIGAPKNFSFCLLKAKGKYFMWAAGHDKWSPNLLSQCVNLLEESPTLTIAFGTPVWIGEEGDVIEKQSGWSDTRGLNPVARMFTVFWGSMNPVLGVIRKKEIPNIDRYNFAGGDLVILSELAIKGAFAHAPDACFYRRQNRPAENYQDKLKRFRSKDTKIGDSFPAKLFPLIRLPVELCRIVIKSKTEITNKFFIFFILLFSLPIRYITGKKDYK